MSETTTERELREARAEVERLRDALALAEIDVSLERSWCRLCRTEDRSRSRGRASHVHAAECLLAAHPAPAPLATMRASECSCVDYGRCGISYAGCPVHDAPIAASLVVSAPAPRNLPCVYCHGTGLADPRHSDRICERCGGRGADVSAPGGEPSADDFAQAAYEAHNEYAREYVGPAPEWSTLPAPLRNAWTTAIECAFELRDNKAEPPSAPEPKRERVTHEQAVDAAQYYRACSKAVAVSDIARADVLDAYIAQQAELERRAREARDAEYALREVDRSRSVGGVGADRGAMNTLRARRTAAIDALAELLPGGEP